VESRTNWLTNFMSNGEYLDQLSLDSKSPKFRDSKNEKGSDFSIFIYKYLPFMYHDLPT
jgi:hypothetical protein